MTCPYLTDGSAPGYEKAQENPWCGASIPEIDKSKFTLDLEDVA